MPVKYAPQTSAAIRRISKPKTLRITDRLQRNLTDSAVLFAKIRDFARKHPCDQADALEETLSNSLISLNSTFQDVTTVELKALYLEDAVESAADYAADNAQLDNQTTDELLAQHNSVEPLSSAARSNYAATAEQIDAMEPQDAFKSRSRGRRHGGLSSCETKFLDFRRAIQRVEDPHARPLEVADLDQYYGDVFVDSVQQSYICPITRQIFENPVKAPCGHVFSQAAVEALFQPGNMSISCPQMGCTASIQRMALIPDQETAVAAARWKAAQDRQEQQARSTLERV